MSQRPNPVQLTGEYLGQRFVGQARLHIRVTLQGSHTMPVTTAWLCKLWGDALNCAALQVSAPILDPGRLW